MLTPRFELSQDEEFLLLLIHAPYAKVAETEFDIYDENICFYSKPYYLRLHLPKCVEGDDDRNEAKYDVDTGKFTARIVKKNKGEVFEGLDMLTKLLTPPDAIGNKPVLCNLVQEIDSDTAQTTTKEAGDETEKSGKSDSKQEDSNEEEFDWYIEQIVPSEAECTLMGNPKYGFALQKSGLSGKLLAEFGELLDVSNPDSVSSSDKKQQRHALENQQFCEEHYLADKYENTEILEILNYKPWWTKTSADCKLSKEETDLMLKLPKKGYILDKEMMPVVCLGLVDIIFAYAYNHRTVQGENNVMSGWTITKLAPTLSWLDTFTSLHNVVISSFRRALIYPLYRNWDLCLKVLEDVQILFAGGKRTILKCLLDTYSCMVVSDPHYIFNDLYITDYCVWIQSIRNSQISSLAKVLKKITVNKVDMELELMELEFAAELVLEEQSVGIVEVAESMDKLKIGSSTTGLDSDDDSECDEEVKENGNIYNVQKVASKNNTLQVEDPSTHNSKQDFLKPSEESDTESETSESDTDSEDDDLEAAA